MNKIISQEKDVRYEMNRDTLKNEGGSNSTIGTVNTPLTFDLENNWNPESFRSDGPQMPETVYVRHGPIEESGF